MDSRLVRLTPARGLAALALLACTTAGAAPGNVLAQRPSLDALLPAAQAFDLMPVERHGAQLHLSWNIAPGYYLYRQRIRVELLGPTAAGLQPIRLPQGIDHVDEYFGAVQIYRGLLEAEVPLNLPAAAARQPLRLRVSFQGCADAGVCYPPQTLTQTLNP